MTPVYRGWNSTKLHTCLISMGLLTFVYAFTGFDRTLFGEYCMAVCGLAGAFMGADVVAGRGPRSPAP